MGLRKLDENLSEKVVADLLRCCFAQPISARRERPYALVWANAGSRREGSTGSREEFTSTRRTYSRGESCPAAILASFRILHRSDRILAAPGCHYHRSYLPNHAPTRPLPIRMGNGAYRPFDCDGTRFQLSDGFAYRAQCLGTACLSLRLGGSLQVVWGVQPRFRVGHTYIQQHFFRTHLPHPLSNC